MSAKKPLTKVTITARKAEQSETLRNGQQMVKVHLFSMASDMMLSCARNALDDA